MCLFPAQRGGKSPVRRHAASHEGIGASRYTEASDAGIHDTVAFIAPTFCLYCRNVARLGWGGGPE
jgi:hypothetical protein